MAQDGVAHLRIAVMVKCAPERIDEAQPIAGTFASQGQLRATMLASKTAELTVLGRAHSAR